MKDVNNSLKVIGPCVWSEKTEVVSFTQEFFSHSTCLTSQAPARCVGHSVQSKKQQQLVVDVCKGALNMAPADCLDLLPRSMPQETARRLCGQAETLGPALCANTPGQLSYGPDITARLCQGAVGQGPALCFRRSYLAARLPMENRMDLCYGAMSDAPAR